MTILFNRDKQFRRLSLLPSENTSTAIVNLHNHETRLAFAFPQRLCQAGSFF